MDPPRWEGGGGKSHIISYSLGGGQQPNFLLLEAHFSASSPDNY